MTLCMSACSAHSTAVGACAPLSTDPLRYQSAAIQVCVTSALWYMYTSQRDLTRNERIARAVINCYFMRQDT